MYDLVAIGNPVYDEIITPRSHVKGRILSGCSTNACLTAKRLGLKHVGLIGCIGSDYEKRFKEYMKRSGVELINAKISKNTGGFRLIYDSNGNRTLDVIGVADKIHPQDLPSKCFNSKTILLAPILHEIDIDLINFLKKNTDAKIFLDPQGIVRKIGYAGKVSLVCDNKKAATITSLVDIIKPNEHEARILTGIEDPFSSSQILIGWGAKISIVTLAERGSVLRNKHSLYRIPAYKTSVIDPTGAGDTYFGAFITKFLEGKTLFECAVFASTAASIKIGYVGPDFPMNYAEASRRMNELL